MEESLLKLGEFGALGIITVLMLTKGMSALKSITDAMHQLSDTINSFSNRVEEMEKRSLGFEYELKNVSSRLDKIENSLASLLKEKS